ncbi:MAG TPA: hypothetical protein VFO40_27020 [Chthoniobacterales bacterium]|nr:hypothetical protein [Chthoniobacterales bacterium]
MAEAISLAKELNDMRALAIALWHAGILAHFERNPAEVERLASDLSELSTRLNFEPFLQRAAALRGWARSASGNTAEGISWIEDAIGDYRATASILDMPFLLALKAEALHLADRTVESLEAIREADALVERFENRYWSAELHRLSGVFLATASAEETQIEASFLRSHQNRKAAKVGFAAETRGIQLCRIPSPKSERVVRVSLKLHRAPISAICFVIVCACGQCKAGATTISVLWS